MAATTNLARDAPALIDPEPELPDGGATGRHRRTQVRPDDLRAYHRIGRMLLEAAARTGRRSTAAAAVEVFRNALERASNDASFRNGLGAALLERARLEPGIEAMATLKEAARAFQAAATLAVRRAAPRAVA